MSRVSSAVAVFFSLAIVAQSEAALTICQRAMKILGYHPTADKTTYVVDGIRNVPVPVTISAEEVRSATQAYLDSPFPSERLQILWDVLLKRNGKEYYPNHEPELLHWLYNMIFKLEVLRDPKLKVFRGEKDFSDSSAGPGERFLEIIGATKVREPLAPALKFMAEKDESAEVLAATLGVAGIPANSPLVELAYLRTVITAFNESMGKDTSEGTYARPRTSALVIWGEPGAVSNAARLNDYRSLVVNANLDRQTRTSGTLGTVFVQISPRENLYSLTLNPTFVANLRVVDNFANELQAAFAKIVKP